MTDDRGVEDLLRTYAPRVLAALVRRHGQFDRCEDAVQEALIAAARQWPAGGVPDRPAAWLATVAGRALVDGWRSDQARRRREATVAADPVTSAPAEADDTLDLLFLCCHPAVATPAQLALTLRAVGGLTTTEIAAALLVPDATVAKRITRAKAAIRSAGARFETLAAPERTERTAVVRHVLYLIFNEGYAASQGPRLYRPDLSGEAIRLARMLHGLLPGDAETAGLLALMLLTDARRAARSDSGVLVPLAGQDRTRWDAALIAEGRQLLTRTLGRGAVGPYQLQAAIAAVHSEAATAEATDWPQILALYDVLTVVAPGPVVLLSRAVAVSRVHGPAAGLALIGTLDAGDRHAYRHRLAAVRAHLLEEAGDPVEARSAYLEAARLATSGPEQDYLRRRAAAI